MSPIVVVQVVLIAAFGISGVAKLIGGTDFVRTWTPRRGAFAAVLLVLAVPTILLRLSSAA